MVSLSAIAKQPLECKVSPGGVVLQLSESHEAPGRAKPSEATRPCLRALGANGRFACRPAKGPRHRRTGRIHGPRRRRLKARLPCSQSQRDEAWHELEDKGTVGDIEAVASSTQSSPLAQMFRTCR